MISGPSSAGKTMLCRDWCNHHPEFHRVEEVARVIMKDKKIDRPKLECYVQNISDGNFMQFQQDIFDKQERVERKEMSEREYVILDRGPDPIVFAAQVVGHDAALKLGQSPSAQACFSDYKWNNSLLVIMCPLGEIEDDGVRYVPTRKEQYEYIDILKYFLGHYKVPFEYCDKTDRMERVQWLQDMLNLHGLKTGQDNQSMSCVCHF